eukprot:gene3289-5979_t
MKAKDVLKALDEVQQAAQIELAQQVQDIPDSYFSGDLLDSVHDKESGNEILSQVQAATILLAKYQGNLSADLEDRYILVRAIRGCSELLNRHMNHARRLLSDCELKESQLQKANEALQQRRQQLIKLSDALMSHQVQQQFQPPPPNQLQQHHLPTSHAQQVSYHQQYQQQHSVVMPPITAAPTQQPQLQPHPRPPLPPAPPMAANMNYDGVLPTPALAQRERTQATPGSALQPSQNQAQPHVNYYPYHQYPSSNASPAYSHPNRQHPTLSYHPHTVHTPPPQDPHRHIHAQMPYQQRPRHSYAPPHASYKRNIEQGFIQGTSKTQQYLPFKRQLYKVKQEKREVHVSACTAPGGSAIPGPCLRMALQADTAPLVPNSRVKGPEALHDSGADPLYIQYGLVRTLVGQVLSVFGCRVALQACTVEAAGAIVLPWPASHAVTLCDVVFSFVTVVSLLTYQFRCYHIVVRDRRKDFVIDKSTNMSGDHHESRFLSSIRAVGSAVKRSPQMMRKKFGQAASSVKNLRIGHSKHYSALEDCESNGWLHSDEQIMIGVPFAVKYLGSMEIDFVPNNPQANSQLAAKVMHKLKSMNREEHNVTLTIAAGRIVLTRAHHEILMRHSTSRIAYSTVDQTNSKLFCYVALPRNAKIALCHTFLTKSAKKSYEMTFACAHAFNLNYQRWQESRTNVDLLSHASEAGDVEPKNPMRSPEVRRRLMVRQQQEDRARSSSLSKTETARTAPIEIPQRQAVTPQPDGSNVSDEPPQLTNLKVTVTEEDGVERNDDTDLGYIQIDGLEVEDEEEIVASADHYFAQLAQARSEPSLLEIGVDPEQYNRAKALEDTSSDEEDNPDADE